MPCVWKILSFNSIKDLHRLLPQVYSSISRETFNSIKDLLRLRLLDALEALLDVFQFYKRSSELVERIERLKLSAFQFYKRSSTSLLYVSTSLLTTSPSFQFYKRSSMNRTGIIDHMSNDFQFYKRSSH